MKRILLSLMIISLFVTGCAKAPVATQATAPVETVATETMPTETMPTETVAETAPEEPEAVAAYITEGLCVRIGDRDVTGTLTDQNHYSKIEVAASASLVLESETPFYSLYAIWDALPGAYRLVWDGGELPCGEHGFLHEYIALPEPVTKLQIVFEESRAQLICDFCFFTEGRAPQEVQLWQPPAEQADILAFPTHADDEVLFFGPTLVYYAMEKGLTVQVAYMVEHLNFPEHHPERDHERLDGLWTMGIRNYPILGKAPDLGMFDFDFAFNYYAPYEIERWQVEQIRRFKPLVIIGHDELGEYGNAGHMINVFHLKRAIENSSNPEKYPQSAESYGTWDTPKVYLHLYRENEMEFDVNKPMEKDPLGRTPFEIAALAMECHESQVQQWGFRVQQGEERAYDCRFFGLYRTLVGYDTTADMMENIDPSEWRKESKEVSK